MNCKRFLWAIFCTTEGDGDGSGQDGGDSTPPAGDSIPEWVGSIDGLDEGQKELFKGLDAKTLVEKIQGPQIPEAYALPEGIDDSKVDKNLIASFSEVAREAGLTQAQWNSLVSHDIKARAEQGEATIAEAKSNIEAELKEWQKENGATKAQESITGANKVLESFGTEGFVKLLDETGLRNSPDVVMTLAKIAEVLSEDSMRGANQGGEPTDRQSKLAARYPSMNK